MPDEDESGTTGGAQGSGSGIQYRDILASDRISPEEKKRRSKEHQEINSHLVDKQQKLVEERKEIKSGKKAGHQHAASGPGQEFGLEAHPILKKSAAFAGQDKKTTYEATEFDNNDINPEKKKELTKELTPEPAPRPGFTPPRLTPT